VARFPNKGKVGAKIILLNLGYNIEFSLRFRCSYHISSRLNRTSGEVFMMCLGTTTLKIFIENLH
jgi:hypothetical protein